MLRIVTFDPFHIVEVVRPTESALIRDQRPTVEHRNFQVAYSRQYALGVCVRELDACQLG
jgi:hypothetical protein